MLRIAPFIAGLVFASIAVITSFQTGAAQDSSKGGTISDEVGQDGERLPAAISPR
jgi:hypothetical protein